MRRAPRPQTVPGRPGVSCPVPSMPRPIRVRAARDAHRGDVGEDRELVVSFADVGVEIDPHSAATIPSRSARSSKSFVCWA